MTSKVIRKAVIPVAGFGTRMLPASKSIPKELITLLDKPIIHYVIQEAISAGIDTFIFISHLQKTAIENYFDDNAELEQMLINRQKLDVLKSIETIPKNINLCSVRQSKGKGLGHAVLCAKHVVGDEPFAVLLPDVVVNHFITDLTRDNLAAMITRYNETKASQILVEDVAQEDISKYGIADVEGDLVDKGKSMSVKGFVEKPAVNEAPSNLAIVGRYVFDNRIFDLLEDVKPDSGGEIQLTDAIDALISQHPVEIHRMVGKSHDNGSKLGYVSTFIEFAKSHPDYQHLFD